MRKLVILLLLICASAPATADPGTQLIADCRNGAPAEAELYCLGYIRGVLATHEGVVGQGLVARQFCEPGGVNTDQFRRVFVKYLEAHPELIHVNGSALLLTALRETWPCPKPSGK